MTATAPELSKSDFFDFVTLNEITDAQYKQQMRSVNVFMDSSDSRSNPLLSDDPKEQNNNCLLSVSSDNTDINTGSMTSASTSTTLQSFDSIWNVDRDRDRLETAMLEDLNKYYWSHDNENGNHTSVDTAISNKLISNNTDGQIYTLTVLNQDINEPNPNRFWSKDEEVSISSPVDIEQPSALDLESILNMNGFPNDFAQDTLGTNLISKTEPFNYDEVDTESQSRELNADILVKNEPYNFEDSDFQTSENKDNSCSSLVNTPSILEPQAEFNNNNNDWKLTDQNTESQESLLRSALQGKAFIRYSTIQKNNMTKHDGNTQLKRVIINNNKEDVPSMYQDTKDANAELLMAISPQNGNVNISILLEDPNTTVLSNGENHIPSQSVEDIFLPQLDTTYPEDFEKLKRLASELNDSVPNLCTVEPLDPTRNVYNIHHLNGELVTMINASEVHLPHHLQIVTASPTVTSTKTVTKNKKRVQNKSSPPSSQMQSGTAIQAATSTSNGVRKERSLHYCSICSKGFKDKYSVNVHVRTHTGEKPFACSLCGKSFRQKAHLAKHYQTHIAQKTAAVGAASKTGKQR